MQAAFNAVTSSTTTVNIPACSGGVAWTTGITLTVPSGSTSLSVIGAGNSSIGGGDQTVLIDNINRSSGDTPMLSITALSGATELRIAGITFKTNGSSYESYNGSVVLTSSSTTPALVRIDHSHLALSLDGKQAAIGGCVYGVMDHSILDLTSATTNNGIFFDQNTCGGSSPAVGNGQWNQVTNPGSEQSFYLENDVFNGGVSSSSNIAPFVDDCSGGGRFVFRFDTMNGVEIQGHATGHSDNPPDRGCRAYEIYQNTFTGGTPTWPASAGFFDTSGTGLMWGNNVTGYYKDFVAGDVDRTSAGTYTQAAPPSSWGYCSSTAIGGVGGPSNWDGNLSGQNGYPCLDGMGRGIGDLLTGSFPTVCDSTLGCSTYNGQWPNQALEPIYEWLDAWTTVPGWGSPFWSQTDSQTQQNRDYYLSSNVGSGANCTGFTGATGVGCGTRASRPSTCTAGVAYWSTDQGTWNTSGSGGEGVLDLCTATNTWTNAWYTPYTYPHPLDTTQVGPAPPPNVQAVFP